jgi:iron-sulfur cluster repair protein YtfE (RIC family)
MKVTVLLQRDHETVKALFARYGKENGKQHNGRKELFEAIRREIMIHSQMETEIFYPALESTVSSRAGELIAAARSEHQDIERLLYELGELEPEDRKFDTKMNELIEAVNKHIEVEEEDIFDEARKNLPEFRLEELGLEVEQRRKLLGQLAA